MITVYLEDQQGGVAVVLGDANVAPYYPAPTVGAARVVLYARDKEKGVDAAFIVAEGKPGGEFSIPYAALSARDMEFAAVSFSATGTPSVSDLAHADWGELAVAAGEIEVATLTVTEEITFVGGAADSTRESLGVVSEIMNWV